MSDDESEIELEPYQIVYDGEEDDEPKQWITKDGRATVTYPNSDTYVGDIKNGTRNGQGTYTWLSQERYAGCVYKGGYVDGRREGMGVMTFPDGGVYKGEFKRNGMCGQGTYFYPNGDRYCGQWGGSGGDAAAASAGAAAGDVADAGVDGAGTGRKHGHGTYCYGKDETMVTGQWVDGECAAGSLSFYDTTTAFTATFSGNPPSTTSKTTTTTTEGEASAVNNPATLAANHIVDAAAPESFRIVYARGEGQ